VKREERKQRRRVKLAAIGNSRGIRLPKAVLTRYGFGDELLLEEREDGVFLRSTEDGRLSWEETFRETAAEKESWALSDPAFLGMLDDAP
jgi:antitoxin MazE